MGTPSQKYPAVIFHIKTTQGNKGTKIPMRSLEHIFTKLNNFHFQVKTLAHYWAAWYCLKYFVKPATSTANARHTRSSLLCTILLCSAPDHHSTLHHFALLCTKWAHHQTIACLLPNPAFQKIIAAPDHHSALNHFCLHQTTTSLFCPALLQTMVACMHQITTLLCSVPVIGFYLLLAALQLQVYTRSCLCQNFFSAFHQSAW